MRSLVATLFTCALAASAARADDVVRDRAGELPVEGKQGQLVCPEGTKAALDAAGNEVKDDAGAPVCRPVRQFIKGELTNLGSSKLVVNDSRFGLRMGYARLDQSSYLALSPELDLRWDKFSLGLGVPLNVRAYANGFADGQGYHLRPHDYDQASDYAKIIRFITYGSKEEQLYLNVSPLFAATIGHGAIVRRYSGNTDQNITRVGAELDAYGRYGGFEAFVGDVVQPTHFMSGLVFLKPLGFLNLSPGAANTWGQTSIGVSAAADASAPFTLSRDPAGRPVTSDQGEPIVLGTQSAVLVGADIETKVVKTEGADIKPYVDYSRLVSSATFVGASGSTSPDLVTAKGGGGFTAGVLGRFNAVGSTDKVHAFRVVLEGRYFDGNYIPGYFDTFYEVQKYQFITGAASANYNPKLYTLLAQDPASKRAGFYVEAAYQYNGGFAVMAAYEDAATVSGEVHGVGGRNFTFHMEYPAYSWLQFFGSFYRRGYSGSLIPSSPYPDDMLIYGAARLHVLPILFLNARYYRTWQADPVLGQMQNQNGVEIDLELGYEFDRRSAKR
jgi:hypothetical protein